MRYLRQNTAVLLTVGPFLDKTDGVTLETGLTIANEKITFAYDDDDGTAPNLVLDNATGSTTGDNALNYITDCDAALMQLALTAANTNHVGRAFLTVTDAANHCPVFCEFMLVPQQVYDSLFGTDLLAVDAREVSSDSAAADNLELACDGGTYNVGGGAVVAASVTATVAANLVSILGTALTETAGYLAAGFKKFFNVADAGVPTAAQLALEATLDDAHDDIQTEVALIKAKTNLIPASPAVAGEAETAFASRTTGGAGTEFLAPLLALAPSGSGLTAQETRDAMKLAPSAGDPDAGSVDAVLGGLPADIAALPAAVRDIDNSAAAPSSLGADVHDVAIAKIALLNHLMTSYVGCGGWDGSVTPALAVAFTGNLNGGQIDIHGEDVFGSDNTHLGYLDGTGWHQDAGWTGEASDAYKLLINVNAQSAAGDMTDGILTIAVLADASHPGSVPYTIGPITVFGAPQGRMLSYFVGADSKLVSDAGLRFRTHQAAGISAADVRQEMDANSTRLAAIEEDTGTTLPAAIAGLPTPLDAAGTRGAVGLAAADLDAQLAEKPMLAQIEASAVLAKEATLGTPAGASLAADIAAIEAGAGGLTLDQLRAEGLAKEVTVLGQFGVTYGITYPLVRRDGVINLTRGDVATINFTLSAAFPLTGKKVYFCAQARKAVTNATAIVNRVCTIADVATRSCSITLTAEELATAGTYLYEIEVRNTDESAPATAEAGTLNIIEDLRK